MKKTAAFLFLSLAMIGCKKGEEKPNETAARTVAKNQQECLGLEEYRKIDDLKLDAPKTDSLKADWLRKYGKAVCIDTLYPSTLDTHEIKHTPFKLGSGKSFTIKWEDLKKLTESYSAYEKYVGFKIDASKEIAGIEIEPQFSNKKVCYSLPLFRSIARENEGLDISFEFMWALVGNDKQETIVFRVLNSKTPATFFDFSDEPRIDSSGYKKAPL